MFGKGAIPVEQSASSDGILLSRLEEGSTNAEALLTKSLPSTAGWTASTFFQTYVDFLTTIASPARRFRGFYAIFDALYFASAADDDNLMPFEAFFYTNFGCTLANMAISSGYLIYKRMNNAPYKVTNANVSTDFLETLSSVIGLGKLIQNPYYLVDVSREQQWILIACALIIAIAQIIPGIEGKSWRKGAAHSLHESWAQFPAERQSISLRLRIFYGILRLLHTSHVLTIQYSLTDAIALLFQANPYLAYTVNASVVAAPIAFLFLVAARLVLYALYSKTLPKWALPVARFERVLYALNNALFALNAFAYFITLSRLLFEHQSSSTYIYKSFLQSLTVFIPSFLVAIAVFSTAWREYNENFIFELTKRARQEGFDQNESDAVLQQYLEENADSERIIPSRVSDALLKTENDSLLDALEKITGPLVYRGVQDADDWFDDGHENTNRHSSYGRGSSSMYSIDESSSRHSVIELGGPATKN